MSLYATPHLVLFGETALYKHPVKEGAVFFVEYIHSVNQSNVTEIFEVRNGGIVLRALEYSDFGAGMPTEPQEGQRMTNLPDGRIRIDDFDREMNSLNYLVGHVADLILNISEERVPLSDLAEAGTPIEFSIQRLNFWQRIFYRRGKING